MAASIQEKCLCKAINYITYYAGGELFNSNGPFPRPNATQDKVRKILKDAADQIEKLYETH